MLEGGFEGVYVTLGACLCRATPNGMGAPTLPVWRPGAVGGRTPMNGQRSVYGPGVNLYCGALRAASACAVCRVACLEWTMRMGELRTPLPGQGEG